MNCGARLGIASANARQSGFILTLEFILLLSLVGVGLMVGIFAIGDAVSNYIQSRQSQQMVVYDSGEPRVTIGKVIGYDRYETPLLLFLDHDSQVVVDGTSVATQALIGVRDDRFVSEQPIFYTGRRCNGTPCIVGPGDEEGFIDAVGISAESFAGGVSYMYSVQGVGYGIGAGNPAVNDGLKGRLFRQSGLACPSRPRSAWDSKGAVAGSPCVRVRGGDATGLYAAEGV